MKTFAKLLLLWVAASLAACGEDPAATERFRLRSQRTTSHGQKCH